MGLVDQLKNLGLDYLDHGWVKAIYQTEFLEFCDLPPEYESAIETLDLSSTFEDIIMSTDSWLNSEAIPTEEKTWASLSKLIQHEKVLAILAYYVNYGCKNVHTKEYRNNALLASRVYYKLLTIPGCKAYHIYHSQLFAHSLACLRFPLEMCDEASNFNARDLTNEVNFVLEQLSEFVEDLTIVAKHLQLSPNDLNFEEILSNLVDVTGYAVVDKLHVGFHGRWVGLSLVWDATCVDTLTPFHLLSSLVCAGAAENLKWRKYSKLIDKLILQRIVKLVYDIIHTLLCDATGATDENAITFLFKCILPKLVNSCLDSRHTNKYIGPSYVTYSLLLLAKHGKPALNAYITLLEHLCTSPDGLERADVRETRSKLVVGMMSTLPQSAYTEFIIWLIDLSWQPTKLPHRQIAVEMLAKLLCSELEEQEDFIAGRSNEQTPQPNGDQIVNEQANVPAQPDMMNEGEDQAVVRERRHKVMHRKILRAIFDRTIDDSATIRTRSIVILTKCLTSKHVPLMNAIKDLNGSGEVSRMVAVAARNTSDDRAVVRKAAAGLLQQALAHPDAPPPMRRELTFLVSLCRDASIIVRQSAIAGLAELLTARPSDSVLDAFLDGPLPQISDPEAKVQEQVLGLIEKLVIDRLSKFTAPGCEDPMPWMFLAGIARRKKMAHLQKSCHKLKKSAKCINHRLVDILSSHLGVLNDERDVHCMLLLTSVAPHVDYSDLGFVFDYYYKLCDSEQFRDLRLMKLTLQLLGSWSRFMCAHEKTELLNHLVQRLAEARHNTSRIYSIKLAYQLNPENLTWATEMMQMAERRAVVTCDVVEAVRATDLSLTAPVRPGPDLLRLLLNVANPPPDWDQTRCANAVAGAGRLCIRARDAAATSAPVFATLLARVSEPLAVRVNALIVLSDICARYTCIVEPLLATMSDCLSKDTPVLLRRMGTFQLTRLLVGGFLRLRTPLYYRYCALLADGDGEVREPVEYYVTCGLTVDAIYHHFVECVLYYNHDHKNHIKFDDRQLIYDLMLQRMTLVQKLNIQCRLAREVLEHAADLTDEGDEELPPEMNAALLDTITLLCGPRMKLPKKSQKQGEVNDLEDLQERVTTNIVSHKMKVQVAEVLVPAVLRLYNRLSPRGGQINTYLVQLANDLLKDYEQEIKELFEDNEELMKSVQRFKSTIGVQATFGNVRNLVTGTPPPEPDTPRAHKRRAPRSCAASPRKRALRV